MLHDAKSDRVVPADGAFDGKETEWQTVHRALRSIAKRRAALDAEEIDWLRKAEALEIWKRLGMVSMLDYLERVLSYAPRTAQDRLRVARALDSLPQLTAALASGELCFSTVRELSRVATPATEAAWRDAAAGKSVHEVEGLVADHRPGDLPGDPPDPNVRMHVLRLGLKPDTYARSRQARAALNDEHGRYLDDDEFFGAMCDAVLDGGSAAEPTGRARFQIAVTLCERCGRGWQDGGGMRVPIGADAVERALCDAQHIGSVDGHAAERAYQDIPPSIARLVWHRDGGRCRVPGCRSARGLELHHIVHRADGGTHDALNLALTCSACHRAHHAGLLSISGTADRLEVRRLDDTNGSAVSGGQCADTCVCKDAAVMSECHPTHQAPGTHGGAEGSVRRSQEVGAHGCAGGAVPSRVQDAGALVDTSASSMSEAHNAREDRAARVSARGGGCQEVRAHVCAGGAALSRGQDAGARADTSASTMSEDHNACEEGGAQLRARGGEGQEVSAHVGTSAARGIGIELPRSDPHDRLGAAVRREEVKAALLGLGWKPVIVRAALADTVSALGVDAPFEELLREALRRCPTPSAIARHAG